LLAATDPHRIQALVLANTSARYLFDDDYPIGMAPKVLEVVIDGIRRTWGTETAVRGIHRHADEELTRWSMKLLRASATPRTAAEQYRYILETMDVRRFLPLVQTPTLVLHTRGHPLIPLAHGEFLASHIAGAKLVELGADESYFSADGYTRVLDEISEFLTGERPPSRSTAS